MPPDETMFGTATGERHEDTNSSWADPDLEVLWLHRRRPPMLPIDVFGPWGAWVVAAADAAACPPDYVAMPLLASASALIGNARWAAATDGWVEPPHLWIAAVGDSGTGKSPGADALQREVWPELERRMRGDFPDRLREWRSEQEIAAAKHETWKKEVRDAGKANKPPPDPPAEAGPEPQMPRLLQHDSTIEKVANLLACAAPKGLLIVRDEIAGWIGGMTAYNDSGRQFWLEAHGGRPYRVERQKLAQPINVPRLAVAVYGGTQPERLTHLMSDPDDGLLARFLWSWPTPKTFELGRRIPDVDFAIRSLDRLRELEMLAGLSEEQAARPIYVPLTTEAQAALRTFGQDAQRQQETAGGLMRSAWGKTRGYALRLSLVIEFLWWCAADGFAAPPRKIGAEAFAAAALLVREYFMPMAERVYGDAAATDGERKAATLARWIIKAQPTEVYVRDLQRNIRLPGLRAAEAIHLAAEILIEADWLLKPPRTGAAGRRREAYPVNPLVLALTDDN